MLHGFRESMSDRKMGLGNVSGNMWYVLKERQGTHENEKWRHSGQMQCNRMVRAQHSVYLLLPPYWGSGSLKKACMREHWPDRLTVASIKKINKIFRINPLAHINHKSNIIRKLIWLDLHSRKIFWLECFHGAQRTNLRLTFHSLLHSNLQYFNPSFASPVCSC